jgi:nitrogen fixation-related uncharacterized protein
MIDQRGLPMSEQTQTRPAGSTANRWTLIVTLMLAVAILIPSMLGFVNKFFEFYNVVKGDADGAFALTPIVNYLLASLGFFFLLLWAIGHGMFHDIEAPKHTMLETERRLDESR